MSNIVDTNRARWKTSDYVDTPDQECEIPQHRVKVADYLVVQGSESEVASAASEISYIGSYEYVAGSWITDHTHSNAKHRYYIISGTGVIKVGAKRGSPTRARTLAGIPLRFTPAGDGIR